ncbi:methyl-accepting chemotaxis protein [Vibrio nitrifigilis]|uniref:Methyl-accepting chemotaxis protein n=1 Tax=Vibrio nitrifigilis TaxID=2789781 RepID=A0ABS0GKA7_9VIBR|nr:methyl-accepting chemotaxis protein [Vibrio nitrifigilis]MBF9002772.1 methyl-accepting chemotaxis protein [Vibrio nitrifigilis]
MQWYRNLSITKKLLGLVIILLALVAATSAYAIYKMSRVATEIDAIAKENIPLVKLASDITVKQLQGAIMLEKILRISDIKSQDTTSQMKKYSQQIKQNALYFDEKVMVAKQLLEQSISHAFTQNIRDRLIQLDKELDVIIKHHKEYEISMFSMLDILSDGEKHGELADSAANLETKQDQLDHELEQFLLRLERATEAAVIVTENEEHEALTNMVIISSCSAIFGLLVGIIVSRAIVKGVTSAKEVAEEMAKGNFDQHITVDSKDEVGQLLTSMNHVCHALSRIVSEVVSRADNIAATVVELAEVAEINRQAMSQQQQNTEMVAAAMTQMSTTITEVASNAEGAAASTDRVNSSAQHGCETAETTQALSNKLIEQGRLCQDIIGVLQGSTEKIQNFIQEVDGISEQTNLLALNASIEAARAGEQGRGFAVVADEVRNLASRSQKATQEISDLVNKLVGNTQNAAAIIAGSDDVIMQTSTKIEETKAEFIVIASAIAELSEANLQVAAASEEQSVTSNEISMNLEGIRESGGNVLLSTQETAQASEDLSVQANSLKELVAKFKVKKELVY